jgi:serine/threonine protein kinase
MTQQGLVFCRKCGQTWEGAAPGTRCPNQDAGVLVDYALWQSMPTDDFLGRAVADKYAVIGKLGDGGMGAVYRALQEPVGRPVALKVIASESAVEGDQRGRFFREARVVSRLSDPAVVTLYDYGEDDDGTLFMVFELVEGELLSSLMQREGALAPGRVVAMMQQVLSALMEAHAAGLIHRDLKPENLMVSVDARGNEKIKVLDFGIAKLLDQELDGVQTREGIVLGTPRYMSPEQCQDRALDGRSDLYAIGVLLYEMVVGRPPFDAVSPLDILLAHVREPVPPVSPHLNLPPALVALIEQTLAKDPADRPVDAATLSQALVDALDGVMPEPSVTGVRLPRVATMPETSSMAVVPTGGGARRWLVVAVLLLAAGGGAWFVLNGSAITPAVDAGAAPEPVRVVIGNPSKTNAAALSMAERLATAGRLEDAALTLQRAMETSGDRAGLIEAAKANPKLAAVLKQAGIK